MMLTRKKAGALWQRVKAYGEGGDDEGLERQGMTREMARQRWSVMRDWSEGDLVEFEHGDSRWTSDEVMDGLELHWVSPLDEKMRSIPGRTPFGNETSRPTDTDEMTWEEQEEDELLMEELEDEP